MDEPKGLLYGLIEHRGALMPLDVRPLTKEEAETYVLATVQAKHYEKGFEAHKIEPVYWVPISAFVAMPGPTRVPLTEDMVAVVGECDCPNCTMEREAAGEYDLDELEDDDLNG